MKKFALFTMSLLILIIGVGCASATDINSTIDDVAVNSIDHQCCVDEIDNSCLEDVKNDVAVNMGNSCADDIQNDAGDNMDGHIENSADYSLNGTIDNTINSIVTVKNSNLEPSNQKQITSNIIDDNPKPVDTSVEKQKSLKKDIAKYNDYFKKNHYQMMSNGKQFSELDLILEIYKRYSFEDTVLIATNVLRDNGVKITFTGVEARLSQMIDGTVFTQSYQMNASYYKDEISKIQQSHKSINSLAKKYSEIFNDKNGKSLKVFHGIRYSYLNLIMEVYLDHSSFEETILISTYALKNCGFNVTAASVEDTFNQIMAGTTVGNPDFSCAYFIFLILNSGHEEGFYATPYGDIHEIFKVK